MELGWQGTPCPKLGLGAEPVVGKKEVRHRPTPFPIFLKLVASSPGLCGGSPLLRGARQRPFLWGVWGKAGSCECCT